MKILKLNLVSILAILILFSLLNSGCNKAKKETGVLKLVFDQKVKDKDFEFYKFEYKAKAGYPYEIITLRYFNSDFDLYKNDNSVVKLDTFHYREADKAHEYTKEMTLEIPTGTYNGISFIHGLSDKYNKPIKGTEAHSLPNTVDEYLDMYWPWQEDGQYHYMKYEGAYAKDGDTLSFKLHMGPTNGNKNYITIDKIPFKSTTVNAGDTMVVTLVLDLNEFIENPVIYDFNKFGKGIMKVQEAQDILKKNGKNAYSVKKVEILKKKA